MLAVLSYTLYIMGLRQESAGEGERKRKREPVRAKEVVGG